MLRIFPDVLALVRELSPVVQRIARYDRSLADQLRPALTSTVLNLAEGDGLRGGPRRHHHRIALGSCVEALAALQLAAALDYVPEPDPAQRDRFEHLQAVLQKLTGGP